MKYDIRVNNIFVAEIEGISIEDALDDASIFAGVTELAPQRGILHTDPVSLLDWLDIHDPSKDMEELESEIESSERLEITFGPAE